MRSYLFKLGCAAVALALTGCAAVAPMAVTAGPGEVSTHREGALQDKSPMPGAQQVPPVASSNILSTLDSPQPVPAVVPGLLNDAPNAAAVVLTSELERGNASWYGPRFQGRRTANGERFDMHSLTAAHKTLPFGTMVRVKSLVNGREVLVRITDRGPFTKSRIIDLSRAAAIELDMLGIGFKQVVLMVAGGEVVSKPIVAEVRQRLD